MSQLVLVWVWNFSLREMHMVPVEAKVLPLVLLFVDT
jgi:hypothetical protein